MRQFEQDNVILIEGDEGELTLYVRDENVSAQELALLPEELQWVQSVINQYQDLIKLTAHAERFAKDIGPAIKRLARE